MLFVVVFIALWTEPVWGKKGGKPGEKGGKPEGKGGKKEKKREFTIVYSYWPISANFCK